MSNDEGRRVRAFREFTMPPPNVVIALCDQLRAFEVGCYGNPVIRTPNIDRLAAQGVRFETAVTNNPVCTPARSILLSGQYSRSCTGMVGNVHDHLPRRERLRLVDPTLPEVLRQNGCRTAVIGKWHVDPDPHLVGFDHAVCPGHLEHRYYGQPYWETGGETRVVEEFAPDFELARARRFLASTDGKPFFLFFNLGLPHMPLGPGNLPDEYNAMYDPETVPLRPNVFRDGETPYNEEWFRIYLIWDYFFRNYPNPQPLRACDRLPEGFDLRLLTAYYYGATTCVDRCVGRLMAALEEFGLAEDTIFVFLSDHGDNLGSHHRFNKGALIEESIRIPMIIRWPRGLAPQVNDVHIGQIVDLMPSLLELCGLPVPDSVQGRSFAPVLRGLTPAAPDNVAFIEAGGHAIGVRTPRHLYGMGLAPDSHEIADPCQQFFDLDADPYECTDLAKTNAQADTAAALQARLREWNRGTPWLHVPGGYEDPLLAGGGQCR